MDQSPKGDRSGERESTHRVRETSFRHHSNSHPLFCPPVTPQSLARRSPAKVARRRRTLSRRSIAKADLLARHGKNERRDRLEPWARGQHHKETSRDHLPKTRCRTPHRRRPLTPQILSCGRHGCRRAGLRRPAIQTPSCTTSTAASPESCAPGAIPPTSSTPHNGRRKPQRECRPLPLRHSFCNRCIASIAYELESRDSGVAALSTAFFKSKIARRIDR